MFRRRRFPWRHPYPPPWWPQNEPWPPPQGLPLRDRPAFPARIIGFACAAWILTMLAMTGSVVLSRSVAVVLILGGIWAVLVGLVGGVANRMGAVMVAANRVAGGDYTVRVAERGPRSVRALARSFNTMTERLANHDRVRRDLMADVAHELRTPLTVIQGKLEGLIDGVYPRDAEQLQILLDETRVLSRLVEDLRTLALTESGALKLEREPTDVAALAREVVTALGGDASTRAVALTVDAPGDLTPIAIDPLRIREVMSNLVSNALRHTPSGGAVTVRATATRDAVTVDVRDTGSGMTAEDLARAFDRFYKGATSRGSGLGLTIARNLVTAHGGDIRASSEPGKGTTITFTLPRGQA